MPPLLLDWQAPAVFSDHRLQRLAVQSATRSWWTPVLVFHRLQNRAARSLGSLSPLIVLRNDFLFLWRTCAPWYSFPGWTPLLLFPCLLVAVAAVLPLPLPLPRPSFLPSLRGNNPAPTITSVSPAGVLPGSASQTLTVTGTGYISSTAATLNGVALQTTYVGATSLQVAVPASAIAAGQVANLVDSCRNTLGNTTRQKVQLKLASDS
jgi:hypothetical protein